MKSAPSCSFSFLFSCPFPSPFPFRFRSVSLPLVLLRFASCRFVFFYSVFFCFYFCCCCCCLCVVLSCVRERLHRHDRGNVSVLCRVRGSAGEGNHDPEGRLPSRIPRKIHGRVVEQASRRDQVKQTYPRHTSRGRARGGGRDEECIGSLLPRGEDYEPPLIPNANDDHVRLVGGKAYFIA